MIDTHCHLDDAGFDRDRGAALARARTAGVTGILVPAIRPSTWAALRGLAAAHPAAPLAFALGVHPQIVPALTAAERALDLAEALAAAAADDRVVAIGECGLDGATGERDLQEQLFRAQLRAARALGRPAVIHVLRAHDVAPRILREERIGEVGGVLHSYSGGPELVPVYAALGLAFSFAGPITYASARRPVEAARVVPADHLLAETDAPDQAPARHRGGRSEPAFVADVVAGLAAARGVEVAEVTALTSANARRWFPRAARWW